MRTLTSTHKPQSALLDFLFIYVVFMFIAVSQSKLVSSLSLRLPPCGEKRGTYLPTACNKYLLCVKHLTCIFPVNVLFGFLFVTVFPVSLGTQRWGDDVGVGAVASSWRGSSLPFAVQDGPPVVRPRRQASLRGADGKVLVVAGGEQDVLPRRFGLHTWSWDTVGTDIT